MSPLPRRCPLAAAPAQRTDPDRACPDRACRADGAAPLPREGPERALVLALRFVAAASETGDAACFDAAFAEAEAAFGPRDGALVVARAAALLRAARRDGVALLLLLPPCRFLSADEADLIAALRPGRPIAAGAPPPRATRVALADLAALVAPAQHLSLGPFETTDWTRSEMEASQFPAVLS